MAVRAKGCAACLNHAGLDERTAAGPDHALPLSHPVDSMLVSTTIRHFARFATQSVRHLSAVATESLVIVHQPDSDGVVRVELNAPDTLNALTIDMGEQFEHEMRRLSEDCADVGAVVLHGAGRAFSAGGDLDFLRRRHVDSPSRNAAIMRRFYERFLSIRRLPVVRDTPTYPRPCPPPLLRPVQA